jgi:Phosphomannomutase
MKDRLRISVSGIRGEVPGALNVEVAAKFASAFSNFIEEGRVAVCRDSRCTGHMLEMAVLSSIVASGLHAVDYGLLPTPFLQFLMPKEKYSGGISITGGHNPAFWNAVILLDAGGDYLDVSEGSEVFNIYEAGSFNNVPWKKLGQIYPVKFPLEQYLDELAFKVDRERIREREFKVVADPCNGAASPYLQGFCDFFGIDLILINGDPNKPFPHLPEPSVDNSSQVEAVVKTTGADLGFLLNSDSSRVSFVDERGGALSEELTFPLVLLALKGRIRKAVTTAVTTGLSDWAAQEAGIELSRTKVGQSSVIHTMEAEGAEAGGEGSGSFSLLSFSRAYDSILTLALVLDFVSREEKNFSDLTGSFPALHMKKIKVGVPPEKTYRVMDKLEEVYQKESPDFTDGIRVERKAFMGDMAGPVSLKGSHLMYSAKLSLKKGFSFLSLVVIGLRLIKAPPIPSPLEPIDLVRE